MSTNQGDSGIVGWNDWVESTHHVGLNVSIDDLGTYIDGWADIVEGAGSKAQDARLAAIGILQEKNMPDVSINSAQIHSNHTRKYLVVQTPKGASITIYIDEFGQDLYATWNLYIRPVLNKELLYVIFGIAFVLGLFGAFTENAWSGERVFSFTRWIFSTVGWGIGSAMLVAIAGFITWRNPARFFFNQLNICDIDDIAALQLAIHKGLMRALDSVGISSQLLRAKDQFHAGSRERII